MLHGRWSDYAETYHGGDEELKKLYAREGKEYFEDNFRYSILEIFKYATPQRLIDEREKWWKDILLTRNPEFGYNDN